MDWGSLGTDFCSTKFSDRYFRTGIDEFQRIHEWGGEEAEWPLKAAMETHRNLAYVLPGSKRPLIEAMVSRKGRALWKQVDVLPLPPIDPGILSSALPRLLEQEVLTRTDEGRYAFDDPFFRRWVQVNALGDLGLPVPAVGE